MKKKIKFLGLILIGIMLIAGCGQVAKNTSDDTNGNSNNTPRMHTRELTVASAKVTLQLGQKSTGVKTNSLDDIELTSQSTSIEVNVPEFMTFDVASDINFSVNSLSTIEADGGVTLNIIYNDLLASNLNRVKVVASLQEGNGLVGQLDPSRVIPLEVELVGSSYQPLSTANILLTSWDKPFTHVINQTLRLKLKGDFSDAFRQNYKATINLQFVREVTDVGSVWTQAVSHAPWSARVYSSSVVFDGKLWIIGGGSSGGHLNDIWNTSDGIKWTQIATAPWSGRSEHATVIFDNKIWIIGGELDQGVTAEVWNSTDGINWTQVATPPWSARQGLQAVVYDSKIWITGGLDASNVRMNDVWYSTDGITWTQATGSAAWGTRWVHTYIVFDNKMWILGGYGLDGDNSINYNDVWNSTDGVNWTLVSTAPWNGRFTQSTLVYNNKMWIIGGFASIDNQGYLYNDIWSSSDGTNWTQITNNANWSPRNGCSAAVFKNKMFLMGGHDGNTRLNEVWTAN